MSERQRTASEKTTTVRKRVARGSVDQLKIYGDADDSQTERVRRNEKTPTRKKKKKKNRTYARLRRRLQRGIDYFRGVDSPSEDPEKAQARRSRRFWLILILAAAVMMLGATFLDSRNLYVDNSTVTIVGLESDLEGYRILLLSDLKGRRFGDQQSTLLREINKLSYDIVVMTGDMVGPGKDPTPLYEILDGLPSRKKVYFIAGDSDPGPYTKSARAESGKLSDLVLEDWILGMIERGATFVNVPVKVNVGSTSLWLTPASLLNVNLADTAPQLKEQMEQEQAGYINGIQADYASLPFTSYRYEIAQQALASLEQMEDKQLHISLAHVPPSASFIQAAYSHGSETDKYLRQPELILAGHYCGGVWRLPFLGAFYIPNSTAPRYGWFPAQEDVAGLSSIAETEMYISKGLSTCSDAPFMRFRLLNRPQISLLTLTATLPASMLDD